LTWQGDLVTFKDKNIEDEERVLSSAEEGEK